MTDGKKCVGGAVFHQSLESYLYLYNSTFQNNSQTDALLRRELNDFALYVLEVSKKSLTIGMKLAFV